MMTMVILPKMFMLKSVILIVHHHHHRTSSSPIITHHHSSALTPGHDRKHVHDHGYHDHDEAASVDAQEDDHHNGDDDS